MHDKYEISRQLEAAGLKKGEVARELKLSAPSFSKRLAGSVPFSLAEKVAIVALISEGRTKKGLGAMKKKLF